MVVMVLATLPPRAEQPCEPADCLSRLSVATPLVRLDPSEAELIGKWNMGNLRAGLSGRSLYLFDDHRYVSTTWGDLLPETVFDMGRWRGSKGRLDFDPDPAVTWAPLHDRRYVAVRRREQSEELWLIGLDQTIGLFDEMGRNGQSLRFLSLVREGPWPPGEGERERARLMNDGWNPAFFGR
jgi:hypothetical protein